LPETFLDNLLARESERDDTCHLVTIKYKTGREYNKRFREIDLKKVKSFKELYDHSLKPDYKYEDEHMTVEVWVYTI